MTDIVDPLEDEMVHLKGLLLALINMLLAQY